MAPWFSSLVIRGGVISLSGMASSSIFTFNLINNTWSAMQRMNNPQGTVFGSLFSSNDASTGLLSLVATGGYAPLVSPNREMMELGDGGFPALKIKSRNKFFFLSFFFKKLFHQIRIGILSSWYCAKFE